MRKLIVALCAAHALLLGGCASVGNFTSIYREEDLGEGATVFVDAEQWAVLNIPRRVPLLTSDGNLRRDSEGNIVTYEERVVCSMPSPDAIAAAAASGNLTLDNPGGSSGGAGFSASEAAAAIGLRTQSIQLLRDAMFRMCEGYAAGAIDQIEYGIMLRRFQSNMIAILAIEQLTGAVVAGQAAVSSGANAPELAALDRQIADIQGRIRAKRIERAGQEADKHAQTDSDIEELEQELARAIERRVALVMGSTYGAVGSSSSQRTQIDAQTARAVSQAVESITLAAMNDDFRGAACFEMARLGTFDAELLRGQTSASTGDINGAQGYCLDILRVHAANRERVDMQIGRAIERLIPERGPIPPANLAAIQTLLAQLDYGWSSGDLRQFPTN
ncbi:MAG TPA: hypothetical protein VM915_14415 [Verrucomicrobiae bacterium]|nr:hypothetical protein [Verrucomicrobiae bacterium]